MRFVHIIPEFYTPLWKRKNTEKIAHYFYYGNDIDAIS